jgi:hypothetical protein
MRQSIRVKEKAVTLLTFLSPIFLFLSLAPLANAKPPHALYSFKGSADSKCVPKVSNPAGVLSRNGIGTRGNASAAEKQVLANGIGKIQQLLRGRPLPGSWRTTYNYISRPNHKGRYTWNQGIAAINVRRPSGGSAGQNETRVIHELGHKVGNAGQYGRYKAFVGRRKCGITPYCLTHKQTDRNEEFADSFAAFVTRPAQLKAVCPEAYAFFSTKVFPGSNAISTCGSTRDVGNGGLQGRYFDSDDDRDDGSVAPRAAPRGNGADRPEIVQKECTNFFCRFFRANQYGKQRKHMSPRVEDSGGGNR